MKRLRTWLPTCIVAVFGLTAAELQPGSARSLRLLPQDWTLWGAKASQQFLVLATFDDGLERDVTNKSTFQSPNQRLLLSIQPAGS
jgi:hypothetical protein